MRSAAATVDEDLAVLPDERRALLATARDDGGLELQGGITDGVTGWFVPHAVLAPGYHADPSQPLPSASLASQERSASFRPTSRPSGCGSGVDDETGDVRWLPKAWTASGRSLDGGRSHVSWPPLDEVAHEAIRRVAVATCVERDEQLPREAGRR